VGSKLSEEQAFFLLRDEENIAFKNVSCSGQTLRETWIDCMCVHIRRSDYYNLLGLSVCHYAYNDWETAECILVKFNNDGFYNHCRGILSLYVDRKILTTTLYEILLVFMCAGGLASMLCTCALSFLFYACGECVTLYPYTR
jgi:hypothetical protein